MNKLRNGRAPKANYKIFITSSEKYFSSGYKSKATWFSMAWALEAAKDAAKEYGVENIEIHEYPVTDVIKHQLKPLLDVALNVKITKEKKEILEQKKRILSNAKIQYDAALLALDLAKKDIEQKII